MVIKNVAIFGVTGRLGPFILDALVDSKLFTITILQRADSTTTIDRERYADIEVKSLPTNYWDKTTELAAVLKGQDAFVSVMPGTMVKEQRAIGTACCMAKVQKMIPADYGSVDSSDSVCIDLVPLYAQKKVVRDSLQGLSLMYPGFYWTAIISGHFLDYGLESPLLGYNLSASPPSATIFDGGNIKWSASSRKRIGEAVVKVLTPDHEVSTRNKIIYIESVNVTQNEVLSALEKASGKKFEVKSVNSNEYIKTKKQELDAGTGHDPVEDLVSVLGVTRANWQEKENYVNSSFGFELESVDAVAKNAWENIHGTG